ncbi:MAG: RraA family protein [Actinobacteria bacterium]|nr:RraA family protein [Actinomycetota bacterium]
MTPSNSPQTPRHRPDLEPLRSIFTAALTSDCLDHLGFRNQVLRSDITMISGEGVMMGYAFPVRLEPVNVAPEVPYVGLLKAIDAVGKDDVFVKPSARRNKAALWGELLSNACKFKGVAGALTDSPVRDVARMRELGFKVFGTGTLPLDINSRFEVVEHNVPAEIDGVTINPGDLIVGDVDGVAVVPNHLIPQVITFVEEKNSGENLFRKAVKDGMAPSEAFAKYGVL